MLVRQSLYFVGTLAIAASAFAWFVSSGSKGPGRIVADKHEALWQSSADSKASSPGQAQVRFVFRNEGGEPVRILSSESSCGCSKLDIPEKVIQPGGRGTVDVIATPLSAGERSVSIKVETDSPVTPEVKFLVRMINAHRPPFLMYAGGDFTYLGGDLDGESRELVVTTVEGKDRGAVPAPAISLDFLKVEPTGVKESPYVLPDTFSRTYTYRVAFSRAPPSGTFVGEIRIADPWDPSHVRIINIQGRNSTGVRVVPERVSPDVGAMSDGSRIARFLLLCDVPIDPRAIVIDRKPDDPIDIRFEGGPGRVLRGIAVVGRGGGPLAPEFEVGFRVPSSPTRVSLRLLAKGD